MKIVKAVGFVCPSCKSELLIESVALMEDFSIKLIGKCCNEYIMLDIITIVKSMGARDDKSAN